MLIVLCIVAGIVVAFFAFVSTRPADFRYERSTVIDAPPAAVFEQVNDFHNWDGWSPWAKIDPAMTQTYEGASSGKGAIYTWKGDKKAGEGRMDILESDPNDLIRLKLEFIKPFAAINTAEFVFRPEGAGTRVVWSMFGQYGFAAKAFSAVMNFDTMVGKDFEKGLTAIKTISESKAKSAI